LARAQKAAEKLSVRAPGKIKVFQNNSNYGLGGTHKAAFLYAERQGFDAVAILHGDNQAKTVEMHELLDLAEAHPEVDAVLGARFMSTSRLEGYSLIRTLGNRALNLVYTLLSGRRTFDLGSGLNIFRLRTLKDHAFLSFSDAFTFNMDLLLDYYRKKSQVIFHPITWREEDQVSNAKAIKVGWITLKTVLRWRFFKPHANVPQFDYRSTLTS
jgi:glycosyltransferase involved in cell wall biosynthesis